MTAPKDNDTSVTRGPATKKAGRFTIYGADPQIAAWKGHKDSMRTETIQGVIGFVDMYHDEYDPKRLVSRGQMFDPMHICRSAKAAGDALPAPQRYIFEVWKMYNGSSRNHALPLKF